MIAASPEAQETLWKNNSYCPQILYRNTLEQDPEQKALGCNVCDSKIEVGWMSSFYLNMVMCAGDFRKIR